MSNKVIQRTKPTQVGVNTSVTFHGNGVDGFIPYTSGTITIVTFNNSEIVTNLPVTAGTPIPLPFGFPDNSQSGTITTAGGASGVLAA